MRRAAAALLCAAALARGGGPELSATLEPAEGEESPWTCLAIRGRTDLPDRAILEVFVYYDASDGPSLLDEGRCETSGGSFVVRLARTKGPPFPGTYRASVSFNPLRQRDEVLAKIGSGATDTIEREARFEVGDAAKREAAIDRERDRVKGELGALDRLSQELSTRLSEARGAPSFDEAAYASWHAAWAKRLSDLAEENDGRPYVRALGFVRTAQAREQGLAQTLADAGEVPVSKEAPETRLPRALSALDRFHRRMRDVLDELGIVPAAAAPFDAARFRGLAEEIAARWKEGRPDEAWLDPWRESWALAIAASLPSLVGRSDRLALDLASIGAALASEGDAAAIEADVDRLRRLLDGADGPR